MLEDIITKIQERTIRFFQHLGLFWFILLCTAMTFLVFFPDFHIFKNDGNGAYMVFDKQIQHPLENNSYFDSTYTAFNSHIGSTKFRLTVPVLARILHLNSYQMVLLQFILLPLFFYLFYLCIFKIINDQSTAYLLSFASIFHYIAESFNFLMPFYDCYAYLFLALAFITNKRIIKITLLLLACFTDERAILGTGVLFFTEYLLKTGTARFIKSVILNQSFLPYYISWVLYFSFRFYMKIFHNYTINMDNIRGIGLTSIPENYTVMAFGILTALEGYWIIIISGLLLLIFQRRYFETISGIFLISIYIISSLMVFDITRTFAYMFPLIFLFLAYIHQTENKNTIQKIGLAVLLINILIPTYFIYGSQKNFIFWMTPIFPKILHLI